MSRRELELLVRDTLGAIGLESENAVRLLLGTCAQESAMGRYRRQLGGGPARGIFQMEPATQRDIYENYLRYHPALKAKIKWVCVAKDLTDPKELERNDRLAICLARVHYLRVPEPIPSDLRGWARYWKQYYNTPRGKGTEEEFIANYLMYCDEEE